MTQHEVVPELETVQFWAADGAVLGPVVVHIVCSRELHAPRTHVMCVQYRMSQSNVWKESASPVLLHMVPQQCCYTWCLNSAATTHVPLCQLL